MAQTPVAAIPTEETPTSEKPSHMKKFVHRRMASLPTFDHILAKSKQLLSFAPEPSPIPQSPVEEYNQVTLLAHVTSADIHRSSSFPTNPLETLDENICTTPTTVVITSPSFTSDLTSEQTESIEQLTPSFLQTQQERRIDHRRNRSDPVKSASVEDLPSTIDDWSLNGNATDEQRRKSSTKITTPKSDAHEKSTPSSSTATARKKKPWYNPFQSTYRQRNDEFRKVFKELPNDERLIVDYSCALQKDILVQGRMYLSQHYLCFYANILNWKTTLSLKFEDIESITREKTAKLIPNAIEIKSNKHEKYFFASFVARDKSFSLMHRIWLAVSTKQPMSSQQIWTVIHESYGDDLDMTTDDEDTHNKSLPGKSSPKQPIRSKEKYDLSNIVLRVPPNSIHSQSSQHDDEHSSASSPGEHQTDDEEIISPTDEATTDTLVRSTPLKKEKADMTNSTENVEVFYLERCPCQSHLATELINRTYSMSVERLFDCIFGNNDFLVAYRASRRIKEFQASEWQVNNETGKRERLCTYKVTVTAVLGSTTICSNEKQMIDCESSNSHYIIDTEVRNEGIRYADSFFVASRYCLVQISPKKSHLKVTCEVRYIKSLMAIIKTFIEKNAMAALQDSFTDLMKRMDQESSKRVPTGNSNDNNEGEEVTPPQSESKSRSVKRQLHPRSHEVASSDNSLSRNLQLQEQQIIPEQINSSPVPEDVVLSPRNTFFIVFCLLTMLLLIVVNLFLFVKLNEIDRMTDRLIQSYPAWLNKHPSPNHDNQWSALIRQQEKYYQTQLLSLQSVLTTTHDALRNVTNTLYQLTQMSSGST